LVVLAAAPFASAHGLISAATGKLGGNGPGLGVVAGGVNSLADVTVFRARVGKFGALVVLISSELDPEPVFWQSHRMTTFSVLPP